MCVHQVVRLRKLYGCLTLLLASNACGSQPFETDLFTMNVDSSVSDAGQKSDGELSEDSASDAPSENSPDACAEYTYQQCSGGCAEGYTSTPIVTPTCPTGHGYSCTGCLD